MTARLLPAILWAVLTVLFALFTPFSADAADPDLKFEVVMRGAVIGTESVWLKQEDGSKFLMSESELQLGPTRALLESKLRWDPTTAEATGYSLSADMGGSRQELKMDREGEKIHFAADVGGTQLSQDRVAPDTLLVLDNMIGSHYVTFLEWLDLREADDTDFSIGVPQPMQVVQARVESLPGEKGRWEGKTLDVQLHAVTVSNIVVHVRHSSAVPHRLLEVDVPLQGFTVRRVGFLHGAGETEKPRVVEGVASREMEVRRAGLALGATFTYPEGAQAPVPGVVLVHGSGPNDRDESIAMNKPFRDIAEGLSKRGIAVLRYDKRTFALGQSAMDPDAMLDHIRDFDAAVIDDAVAAAELLKSQPEVRDSSVFVLGHSMGGTALPYVLQKAPWIAGGISLAGASRPLDVLMVEQTEYLLSRSGTPEPEASKQLEALKSEIAKIWAEETGPEDMVLSAPASFWRDVLSRKPAPVASKLKQPLLFLRGAKDYQVTEADQTGWMEAALEAEKDNAAFKTFPNLNHLFMRVEGISDGSDYQKPGVVEEVVVDEVSRWIRQQGSQLRLERRSGARTRGSHYRR